MEEIIFPEHPGETQATMSRFWTQVHQRMHSDHPELLEKHLPILEDTDSYGRLYAATALHCIMNVTDLRQKAEAARQAAGLQFQNEHRRLA